jgi:hypothetical protein
MGEKHWLMVICGLKVIRPNVQPESYPRIAMAIIGATGQLPGSYSHHPLRLPPTLFQA